MKGRKSRRILPSLYSRCYSFGAFFALMSVEVSSFQPLPAVQRVQGVQVDTLNKNKNVLNRKAIDLSSFQSNSISHSNSYSTSRCDYYYYYSTSTNLQMGKPKSGSIVDTYQTVSVNCKKCRTRLFRYKKKNGTKSNLVKCYIERISEDCEGLVADRQEESKSNDGSASSTDWICPKCGSRFGRDSLIHGRPAIKLVGGKIQMTKK
jgi:hypothetical protein